MKVLVANMQILLHLRSLFWLHGIAFAIIPFATYLDLVYFMERNKTEWSYRTF